MEHEQHVCYSFLNQVWPHSRVLSKLALESRVGEQIRKRPLPRRKTRLDVRAGLNGGAARQKQTKHTVNQGAGPRLRGQGRVFPCSSGCPWYRSFYIYIKKRAPQLMHHVLFDMSSHVLLLFSPALPARPLPRRRRPFFHVFVRRPVGEVQL